jgi:hypothetical protein
LRSTWTYLPSCHCSALEVSGPLSTAACRDLLPTVRTVDLSIGPHRQAGPRVKPEARLLPAPTPIAVPGPLLRGSLNAQERRWGLAGVSVVRTPRITRQAEAIPPVSFLHRPNISCRDIGRIQAHSREISRDGPSGLATGFLFPRLYRAPRAPAACQNSGHRECQPMPLAPDPGPRGYLLGTRTNHRRSTAPPACAIPAAAQGGRIL